MTPQAYENPAIKQWMLAESYSSLSGVYRNERQSKAIDRQRGDGLDYWGIEADSYIKHKSSTLWGSAAYHNGHERSVVWNESSDADLIYPYFTADSVGGDLKGEIYSFSGGYADHNERWSWGVSLGYTAGLYYRNVDPRPRNVTGKLDISAGGAMRIGSSDYHAGVSVNFRKYKQTCSLEFVNEMTTGAFWHLTGLGTHYQRFTSNSSSHYYNGQRWGASLDLYPSSQRGGVLSVNYSNFAFDHILTGLNKLPLASVSENSLRLQGGWLAPGEQHDWAVNAGATITKRTGTENIFGDPASSIYPQIGSMDMYTHTLTALTVSGLWQWRPDNATELSVKPEAVYERSRESYADPKRHITLSHITPGISLRADRGLGRLWRMGVSLSAHYAAPADCNMNMEYDSSTLPQLRDMEVDKYDILSKSHTTIGAGVHASRAINNKYALQLSGRYNYGSYAQGIRVDNVDIALSFIF